MGKKDKSKKKKDKKKELNVEEDFSDLDDLLDDESDEEDLVDIDEDPREDRSIPLTRLDSVGEMVSRGEEKVTLVSRNAPPLDCEEIRRPLMSGHCAHHSEGSHERCTRNGSGNRANPGKIFQPCPCRDHFPEEEYECECGATIVAAPHYPLDEGGDIRYVHLDPKTGRVVDEECPR